MPRMRLLGTRTQNVLAVECPPTRYQNDQEFQHAQNELYNPCLFNSFHSSWFLLLGIGREGRFFPPSITVQMTAFVIFLKVQVAL